MSGPAYSVASTAISTTGSGSRAFLLFRHQGELREVNAWITGGVGGWKPIVYYVTTRLGGTPSYVPAYFQDGTVYSTQAVISGGTFTTLFPDPTSPTEVSLQPIPANEWTDNAAHYWTFTWKPGEGPVSRGGVNTLDRKEVCVVLAATGSTVSTARFGINCLWAPEGFA